MEVRNFVLPESVTEDQLVETLEGINHDSGIHGCLMFRPLPPHLDTPRVARTLDASKDVDAMTSSAMGVLLSPSAVGYAPCTAQASLEILKYYQIPLQGKRITVIGKAVRRKAGLKQRIFPLLRLRAIRTSAKAPCSMRLRD